MKATKPAGAPAAPPTTGAPAPPKVTLEDPQWARAIAHWKNGNTSQLEKRMRSGAPVPDGARPFLADLIAGKAKKKRGRPVVYPSLLKVAIKSVMDSQIRDAFKLAFWAEQASEDHETETPTERALARCAEKFDKSVDQISKIVFPRKAAK